MPVVPPTYKMFNTFPNVFEMNIILLVSSYFKHKIMKNTHLKLFH